LVVVLHLVLVHVGVLGVDPADVGKRGGEERGVLVAVGGVGIGGGDGGGLVD
jgi:hypothetical protein